MVKGLVSIIIPCYNGERFVDRCLSSILAQTYKSIEVIVVNDGSTDNSAMAIENYKNRFNNDGMVLTVISKENGGAASAVNVGLKAINGEFLHPLDIDDMLMPTAIEEKLKLFRDGIDAVISNGYYVKYEDSEKYIDKFYLDKDDKELINPFEDMLLSKLHNWSGAYMVKCSTLFDIYPEKEIYISHYGQNLQIILPCCYRKRVMFSHKPLMKYVRHNESFTAGGIDHSIQNLIGFKDIRLKLISDIVTDSQERDYYRNKVEAFYAKLLIEQYSLIGNNREIAKNYKILKKLRCVDKNSKFTYFSSKHPQLSRILRHIKKLVKNISRA